MASGRAVARPDDPKLGEWIVRVEIDGTTKEELAGFQVVLVGFPHDEGVRRNGGRVGAAQGPERVFSFIGKVGTAVNPEFDVDLRSVKVATVGCVAEGLGLEEAHARLAEVVAKIVSAGAVPFVIGGGNDQSYPNALGYLQATRGGQEPRGGGRAFNVVNVDAHLDVRPLLGPELSVAHSGSPFRQLLQHPDFHPQLPAEATSEGDSFAVFAAQGHQCSAAHVEFIRSSGGQVVWLGQACAHSPAPAVGTRAGQAFQDRIIRGDASAIFLSFDLDSVSGADAPGVSCPAAIGLSAQDACDIFYRSGLCGRVGIVDVSECNPVIEDYRTPRLVALFFYSFILGLASQKSKNIT